MGGGGANKTLESQDSANNQNFPAPEAFPDKHPAVIPFLQRVGFPHEQEEGEHQWIPKKSWECPPQPITGTSVSCPCHWFWVAPELGVVFVRFLLCPALFSECRRGCRPGSCTPPPRYIHSVWSHYSAPKNLGNKGKKEALS